MRGSQRQQGYPGGFALMAALGARDDEGLTADRGVEGFCSSDGSVGVRLK